MRTLGLSTVLAGMLLAGAAPAAADLPSQAPSSQELLGARPWVDRGTREYVAGQFTEAANSYRKAVELEPGNAEAQCSLGSALEAAGAVVDAETAYREAVRLAPGRCDSHVALAGLLAGTGRQSGALHELLEALKLAPHDASVHHAMGMLHLARKDSQRAAECFVRALLINPRHDLAKLGLGRAWQTGGRTADGTHQVELAAAQLCTTVVQDFDARLTAWEAAVGASDPVVVASAPETATQKAVEAVKLPSPPRLSGELGSAPTGSGKRALEETAPQLTPHVRALKADGLAALARGDDRTALRCLAQAADAAPEDPGCVNDMAALQARVGEAVAVRALLEIASYSSSTAGTAAAANLRLIEQLGPNERPAAAVRDGRVVLERVER